MTITNDLVDCVVKKVIELQGCKATDLVTELVVAAAISGQKRIDWPTVIAEAVKQEQIIEIEYVLPGPLDYRCKSFYLPKGTKINQA